MNNVRFFFGAYMRPFNIRLSFRAYFRLSPWSSFWIHFRSHGQEYYEVINRAETITLACMIYDESIMFVMSRHRMEVGVILINYTFGADVFSIGSAYEKDESIIAWQNAT